LIDNPLNAKKEMNERTVDLTDYFGQFIHSSSKKLTEQQSLEKTKLEKVFDINLMIFEFPYKKSLLASINKLWPLNQLRIKILLQ
jgi:hypothetical protein